MYFDGQFKTLGNCDVVALQKAVSLITQEQWSAHSNRQSVFKVHNHTQTIPLLFDADLRHRLPTAHPTLELFQVALRPIFQKIIAYYHQQNITTKNNRTSPVDKGYFIRALIVKMAANSEIEQHTDNGYSLSRGHRIHLPIITNDNVKFTVGSTTKNLAVGDLWEINNRKNHSVINCSDEDRIHFICDFVIPGEVIEESSDQTLYA